MQRAESGHAAGSVKQFAALDWLVRKYAGSVNGPLGEVFGN